MYVCMYITVLNITIAAIIFDYPKRAFPTKKKKGIMRI